MINAKKYIYKFIFFIIIAFNLFIMIIAILKKDYSTLVKFFSVFIGFELYQALDLKVIKPLRKRVLKQDLFSAIIWIISIMFVITNFVFIILSNNKFIESANDGLMFPSIYFAIKQWNIWMEDDSSEV